LIDVSSKLLFLIYQERIHWFTNFI
jgi:hypothetical protein